MNEWIMRKLCEILRNHKYCSNNKLRKKTCGILCSERSTFEVVLYQYLFLFFNICLRKRMWFFLAIFLRFCPSTSVYPNPASHEPVKYKKALLNGPYFFANFLFLSHNFRVFRIIFSRFFAKLLHFLIFESFRIFR